ncbi:YgjV family protein [Flaviaesturariibacter aridisoli]|nr:YgjV family protein [Flaviaesturariibacter aridisoli]
MTALVGYLATLFLALSLLVSNDLQFRWFNTLGCLSFIIYGALFGAFPVILTNTILLVINVYHLIKVYRYRAEEDFDLIPYSAGDPLVQKFLDFYGKDIAHYFPAYHNTGEENLRFFVLRDMAIANVFAASVEDGGTLTVRLNYTVPKYRDFKVGTFLFDKGRNFLQRQNVRRIVYNEVAHSGHAQFLRRMGFVQEGSKYVKHLS